MPCVWVHGAYRSSAPSHSHPLHAIQLSGEAQHWFRMFCMDGNSSLKRVRRPGGRQAVDQRVFEDNDYFLPTSFVDEYAHEVSKNSASLPKEPEETAVGSTPPGAPSSPPARGEVSLPPSIRSETTASTSHGLSAPAADQRTRSLIDEQPTSSSAAARVRLP